MKIIADENIPFLDHYFAKYGELIVMPGRKIERQHVLNADMLLVRSVTEVNKNLLHNTTVKFVGSATTGIDHLDTQWLDENDIKWYAAQGCNSKAVVEYVICVIAAMQSQGLMAFDKIRAGVVGVGNIGSQVAKVLEAFGFEVLLHDPVRALHEKDFISISLDYFTELDFITLHTPLTFDSTYPTYHMINKNFLQKQKPGCILLNTSRGSVIDFADLKQYGGDLHWCLDVWEPEPNIDFTALAAAVIATPHIAGYSVQAKYRGVEMVYHAALQQKIILDEHPVPSVHFPKKNILLKSSPQHWQDIVLEIYDPIKTTNNMKEMLLSKQHTFDQLRNHFIDRYEFAYIEMPNEVSMKEKRILDRFLL